MLCSLFMFVMKPDSQSKTIHGIASHIISDLIIFLLPTIISYPFTLINSYDDSTPLKYYNETALTKIKSLEKQYEEEQKANKAKQIVDLKEANIKKQEEEKKE